MAVITMLLTAPQLKLEQAGRRTAQRKTPERPQQQSSVLHGDKTLQNLTRHPGLNALCAIAILFGSQRLWWCWSLGAAGSAEVKQAAGSSHGNEPVFAADTADCQRRTTSAAGAVMVHWANPQLSLFATGFKLQAPPPKED